MIATHRIARRLARVSHAIRRSAALAATTIVAISLVARAAIADGSAPPPVCNLKAQDPVPDSGNPIFPARTHELWFDTGYLGDWNPHHHPSFSTGLEYVPFVSASQRWRLGARIGAAFGYWGDDRHGWLTVQPGLRARASFLLDDFYDVYVVAKADAPIALIEGPYVGARPGLGLGARLVRYVEIEATFDAAIAIGATYTDSQPRVAPGFGISLGVDLCVLGGCTYDQPKTVSRDFTCRTYQDAATVCRASVTEHAELCEAVAYAMDGAVSVPRGREDATAAFLGAITDRAKSPDLKARMKSLAATHATLAQRRDDQGNDERSAARAGRVTFEHCIYAPYAAELRAALGCSPDGAQTCAVPAGCVAP